MSKKEKLVKVTAAKTFQCMGPKGVLAVNAGDTIEISEDEAHSALHAGLLTDSPEAPENEGLSNEVAELKGLLAEALDIVESSKGLLVEAKTEAEKQVSDLKKANSEIESLKTDLKKAKQKPATDKDKQDKKA